MSRTACLVAAALVSLVTWPAVAQDKAKAPEASAEKSGWVSIFDGKTLEGWDGDPRFWTVKDGAITGTTTPENKTRGNTFIIFVGDNKGHKPVEFGDFELKLEYRIVAHNSGIQYRSFKAKGEDRWRIGGYQADFDAKKGWAGTNYGEKFRGVLAKRGEKVTLKGFETVERKKGKKKGQKRKVAVREVEKIGDAKALAAKIKDVPEWNEYHIIARGFRFVQKINGVTMSELVDNDEANRRKKGLIAIQLHQGPPMVVQVRNIRIKTSGK